MTAPKTITTTELAEQLETDPKTLRRFLRSDSSPVETVGKGHRYILDPKTTKMVQKAFTAWATSRGNQVTPVKVPAARAEK